MNRELFEETLRSYLRRQPFQPFVIELKERDAVIVDVPEAVAFDGGAAGVIGSVDIHFLRCEEVKEIHLAARETAS